MPPSPHPDSLELHPERTKFLLRLRSLEPGECGSLNTTVFRFINPRFSKAVDIASGKGSRTTNGRWHSRKGICISYTSLDPETALAETLAHVRYYNLQERSALPKVIVSLNADLRRVLLLTDGKIRQRLRLSKGSIIETDWRRENQQGNEALTQAWGWAIHQAGYEAALVPSGVAGGENLLVFPENLDHGKIQLDNEVVWPK